MKKPHITFTFMLTHLWVLMSFFSGLLFETLILYPNVFHDVPRSLDTTMTFAVVRGPRDFFAPAGTFGVLTGVGSLMFGWRVKSIRSWIVGSVVIILLGEFLFSMAFFWPRNTIVFVEGTAVHSVAQLKQTAQEFQTGHWLRVALSAAAATSAFLSFLRFYRHSITCRKIREGLK
jgi:hypothetical protein